MTGEVTTRVASGYTPQNGYTGKGMTQQFAGSDAQATLLNSTDKGGMRGIALIAVTIAEIALKNKATGLARDYYNINKKDYEFFISTHQGPIASTVTEAMSDATNPKYVADFYASAPAGMAKSSILDQQWFETRRRTGRYSYGLQRRIDMDFALARLHAVVGGWNIAYRYELTYADEHNNRRFDRKVEVANIGIGIGNVVREGLASSVQNVASAYDNIGDTIASIGNGMAANSGYSAARQATNERYARETSAANVQPNTSVGPR